MMKFYLKALVVVVMLSLGVGAQARRITANEAKASAKSFVAGKSTTRSSFGMADLVLAETVVAEASAEPCYYIFNSTDKHGFIIMTADTELPSVLGYSNQGSYDPSNVAPGFKAWMKSYQTQIEDWYAQGSPAMASNSLKTRSGEHNPIAPLIKTQWGQSAPFNNDCPQVSGKATYTGCTATAMAQVIYYHQWPTAAVTEAGSHTSQCFYPEQTFDFSTATYDWNAMDLTYGASSTAAAKAAVAKLMFAVGVSVDMEWGTSASGAYTELAPYAFYHYFGYSPTAFYWDRDFYSDDEWDAMIYAELEAKRPVVYTGYSDDGGHTFVCDGYDTGGFYHINWGWTGSQDGYYYLNCLNPKNGGYPGQNNQDGAGYNSYQGIVVGIQKPYADENEDVPFPVVAEYGSIGFNKVNASNSWRDDFMFIDPETGNKSSYGYVRLKRPPVYNDAGEKQENRVTIYMPLFTEAGKFIYTPGGLYSAFKNGGYYWSGTLSASSIPDLYYSGMSAPAANFSSLAKLKENLLDVEGYGPGKYMMYLYAKYADYVDEDLHRVKFMNGYTDYIYVTIDAEGNRTYELPDLTGVYVEEVQVTPDEISIKPNESVQLTAVCLPTTAQNKNITWRSENPAIAKVSQDGVVTGVKTGDCNIFAYASDRMDEEVVGICVVSVDPNAGVNTVETSMVTVKGANGVIMVSGVVNGASIEVFDVAGALVAARSGVESAEFALDGAKGVYIVKVGNKSFKVRL